MIFRVQKRIRVKTKAGEVDLEPGAIIQIGIEKARSFIQAGQITPSPLPRNTQSRANVKTVWSPEVQSFIDWFMVMEPHRHVIDPEKFFASLRHEIEIGASCPRNRNGALLFDLKILKKILH